MFPYTTYNSKIEVVLKPLLYGAGNKTKVISIFFIERSYLG